MHEAHRLDGLPEVARGFGGNMLARFGDLQELGFPDGIGGLLGQFERQRRMPPGEGDGGLEHDDDGFEQVPLAQGVRARTELHDALGLHLGHLGLGQADHVVEAEPEHFAGQHDHAAAHGAVSLEQTAVGILAHTASLKDHRVIEEDVEVRLAQFLLQSDVDGVHRVHVLDPVLSVGRELLEVLWVDDRGGDIAELAVELAALAHGQDLVRFDGAEGVVATDELGGGAHDDLGVADEDLAVLHPLLERFRPAEVHRHLLGLFPGLGEEQGVVHVHLRRSVLPFLLELLEPLSHDRDGGDLLRRFRTDGSLDHGGDVRIVSRHAISLPAYACCR